MADKRTIFVVAPRRTRYDELNPQSAGVLMENDRRHPANPAYSKPAGQIDIEEGHGVKGDPARRNSPGGNPPWEVYPTEAVMTALGRRTLVEVEAREDTSDLLMTDDDIGSLESLTARQVEALRKGGIGTVTALVDRIEGADNPLESLTAIKGVGKPTAESIRVELVGRGLIDDVAW